MTRPRKPQKYFSRDKIKLQRKFITFTQPEIQETLIHRGVKYARVEVNYNDCRDCDLRNIPGGCKNLKGCECVDHNIMKQFNYIKA